MNLKFKEGMKMNRFKPENNILIVDEKYLLRVEKLAELKEKDIEKLAEEKFKEYLKDGMNPIQLEFKINGVKDLRGRNVITEMNYDERGYPMSVPEEIKYKIVDDITQYVQQKFAHYEDECDELFNQRYKAREEQHLRKARFWQTLFITSFTFTISLCIYVFRLLTIN